MASRNSRPPEAAARSALRTYGRHFGVDDEAGDLRLAGVGAQRGRTSVRFQQVHDGVPVLAGELVVNLDEQRNVLSINGELLPSPTVDVRPAVPAEGAARYAVAAVAKARELDGVELTAAPPQLWIYDPSLLGGPGARVARLVWRTDVRSTGVEAIGETVLVDAKTGGTALRLDSLLHARDRRVCDRADVPEAPASCTSGYARQEGGAAVGITDVDAAYEYSGHVYDYLMANFGRDSVDGAGLRLASTVRYCPDEFSCPFLDTYWSGSEAVFGAGTVADDLVGHEFTHGLMDYELRLYQQYQSGAIAESLADVFGELIDLGNGAGDDSPGARWLIGEDAAGGAIRNMADPPAMGDPDSMASPLYWNVPDDGGGVHHNSGVNNKAATLMVDGGAFNGVTVAALGATKVAHIYYEALANLLTSGSDYEDLYDILQQACRNKVGVVGITSADCAEVKRAVTATKMNQQASGAQTVEAPICDGGDAPADLFFDDLENLASGNWLTSEAGAGFWFDSLPLYATSGRQAMWGLAVGAPGDHVIARSAGVVPPAGRTTYLRFNHAYEFEEDFDGGVVEYSTDGGSTWVDAGTLFDAGGYVHTNPEGPLTGRGVFTGRSNGYGSSRLDLTPLAGQNVLYRFRIATDESTGGLGWFVDDVRVYTCGAIPAQLYIEDVSVAEGNSGPTSATFNVVRKGDTSATSTVTYATADSTASAGSDYAGVTPTTLSFAPGEISKTVAVTVNGDAASEPNEAFFVNLSAATDATIADAQAVGTITSDDPGALLAINDVTVNEGNSGTAAAAFTVNRSGDLTTTATVKFATAAGTSTAGTDFTSVAITTLTFAPSVTTQTAVVNVTGDTVSEAHETFVVNLSAPTGAVIMDSQGVGTITNDDAGAPSRISINDISVTEGNSGTAAATFTLTRSGTTAAVASVQAATAVSSAGASDFVGVGPTTVSFAIGQASAPFTVSVNGDLVDEANESFFVNLTAPAGATISDSQGRATIVDNEGAPAAASVTFLSVNDLAVAEGDPAAFTITRSGVTSGASSVQVSTGPETATAGPDYVSIPLTTVTFAAGETVKTVTVTVPEDAVPEAHESFVLNLTTATGGQIAISDAQGRATITNDDGGAIAGLAALDTRRAEGGSGVSPMSFTVVRSGTTAEAVSVTWATIANTATAGVDFSTVAATILTFAPGETSKTVDVPVIGDPSVEGNETLLLRLTNPVGATITDDTGIGTIQNDDDPPVPAIRVSDESVVEGNSGLRSVTFTVTRSGSLAGASTVKYATADGTASNGSDYVGVGLTTLIFGAGEAAKTVTVSVKGDVAAEANETMLVNLSAPTGAYLADSQGVAIIRNDD